MTTNEPWWFMWPPDTEHMYCEDGRKRPLQASDYEVTFGKYAGLNLSEIHDEWYLGFLAKLAEEKKDWFLKKCLSLLEK